MNDSFSAILACRKSGQMSDRQWEEHKRDPLFALWFGRLSTKKDNGSAAAAA